MKYTQEELISKVDSVLQQLFELTPEQVKPAANLFTDLGLDSLDAIDMVITFQREFNIKPENSELQNIRTVQDVHALVVKYYDELSKTK